MKNYKFLSKKTIIGGSVIFIAFLFILMAFSPALAGTGQGIQPATAEKSYIPNPTLNSNVSWSTFYNGWNPLEYAVNGTANATLNTGLSTIYQNPISVNPTDIYPMINFNNATLNRDNFYYSGNSGGIAASDSATPHANRTYYSWTSTDGHIVIKATGNATVAESGLLYYNVPVGSLPSSNPNYDYFTMIAGVSGASATGTIFKLKAGAEINSAPGTSILAQTTTETTLYGSQSLGSEGYNLSALDSATAIGIGIGFTIPAGDLNVYTITIYGIGLTEQAISLGTQAGVNGTTHAITNGTGNIAMTSFNPDFKWNDITNGGYTVATSQPMQNITES